MSVHGSRPLEGRRKLRTLKKAPPIHMPQYPPTLRTLRQVTGTKMQVRILSGAPSFAVAYWNASGLCRDHTRFESDENSVLERKRLVPWSILVRIQAVKIYRSNTGPEIKAMRVLAGGCKPSPETARSSSLPRTHQDWLDIITPCEGDPTKAPRERLFALAVTAQ